MDDFTMTPELENRVNERVDYMSRVVVSMINSFTTIHPYERQWILEELIKDLEKKV